MRFNYTSFPRSPVVMIIICVPGGMPALKIVSVPYIHISFFFFEEFFAIPFSTFYVSKQISRVVKESFPKCLLLWRGFAMLVKG